MKNDYVPGKMIFPYIRRGVGMGEGFKDTKLGSVANSVPAVPDPKNILSYCAEWFLRQL